MKQEYKYALVLHTKFGKSFLVRYNKLDGCVIRLNIILSTIRKKKRPWYAGQIIRSNESVNETILYVTFKQIES